MFEDLAEPEKWQQCVLPFGEIWLNSFPGAISLAEIAPVIDIGLRGVSPGHEVDCAGATELLSSRVGYDLSVR